MKLLYYILFLVIFCLPYYFVICQNVPSPRGQQTSTLVGTRLYFFGGYTNISPSNEVWYLDLSSSFNISTPPWYSDVVMPVGYNFGTSCLSPIDNSTVFLIGGRTWITNTKTYSFTSSVYKFDTKTMQWTTPTINNFNSSFETRQSMQAVIDNYGEIFVFGGANYNNSTILFYNDMNMLDITHMTWSTQAQSQSVLTYIDYTATLLPNGLIVYIGGRSGSSSNISPTDLAQIQIFDTKSYTWSAKSASGSTIASRVSHSAVLTQDGNIIVYGGSTHDSSGKMVYVFSDIAVLNTNSWVWSVPSVSGTSAPPLTYHSAALYKNYMIIAFGITSPFHPFANNIYILNIQNYTWVKNNDNSSTDQPINNPSNLYIRIGIGMGVVILAVVLFVIGFFIHKNRHKQEIIATPGTSIDDHIRERHISTIYTPGIPSPAKYELTPTYGVPVPGNNYYSS
ncbi:galactose oxidase [Gigaspora margarita]|uniref:Galactose oxidase n=1 Tax=Gigaspora margarita TaxID=4874 RepID=A0A8H4B038_GIGMA|nr:galactose oxidase [Gigaspora margarita]